MPRRPTANLSASLSCIMCKMISQILKGDLEACTRAQISLWRPFPTSQTTDQWEAQEKAEGQFVLRVLLSRSPFQISPFILHCQGQHLAEVSLYDRSMIDTNPITEWLLERRDAGSEVHQPQVYPSVSWIELCSGIACGPRVQQSWSDIGKPHHLYYLAGAGSRQEVVFHTIWVRCI